MSMTDNEHKLLLACYDGNIQRAKELLKTKINVNCQQESGSTPLFFASQGNHPEVVKLLLSSGAKVDLANKNGNTPLYIASQKNHVEVMNLLIASGANVNLGRRDGFTPLRVASAFGRNKAVEILLKAGADVHQTGEDGATPLLVASQNNHIDVVKLLLAAGAQVDLARDNGATPLYMASQENNVEIMNLLLASGAKVNLGRKDGFTALRIASANGNKDAVQVLLKAGANVDQVGEDNITPLFIASQNNHVDVVKLLLAAHAQVNVTRNDGMTPLITACYNGNISLVQLLLSAEAKTDMQDRHGDYTDTALHIACAKGHGDKVEALISAHADVNIKNEDGECPLDVARSEGYKTIVDLLQSAMLNPPQKPAEPFQGTTLNEDARSWDIAKPQQALPQQTPPDMISQSESGQSQVTESTAQGTSNRVWLISLTDIQLGQLLGRGTFGAVYQGRWKSKHGKRIAVKKILHTPGTSMPEDVTTLQSLPQHPHIITYYGVAQSQDAVYIVTEFAPKGSLYDHLYEKKEKPTFEQSCDWAWQIAHGMEHLHEHNIIHRDLKSANILLCIGNVAKIADFGTARYLDHTTQQTDVRGTYRWMSPEVMEEVEARINKRCDAYSYGMVLYELFEHKIPFHDIQSKFRIGNAVLAGDRPTITCSLPSHLENLMITCWKANPQERPTFTAIVIAFENEMF